MINFFTLITIIGILIIITFLFSIEPRQDFTLQPKYEQPINEYLQRMADNDLKVLYQERYADIMSRNAAKLIDNVNCVLCNDTGFRACMPSLHCVCKIGQSICKALICDKDCTNK